MVHQHLKKAKRRQARYVGQTSQYTESQVGYIVNLKQQQYKSKPQERWYPNYRLIENTTTITFHSKNKLDGTHCKGSCGTLLMS